MKMNKIRLITIPNLATLANLLCGSVAVVAMISQQSPAALTLAFWLTVAAAAFDFLDGFLARLTGQYSPVGAQLDSLADMVSFGLLPTIVAMKIYYIVGGHGAWSAVLFLIVACAALRLARFNVDDSQKNEFRGLPVPACALAVASAGWWCVHYAPVAAPSWLPWAVLVCGAILALLMVSPVRMFSLKFDGFAFIPNALRYVFLAMALVIVLVAGAAGVGLAVVLYILTSVALWGAGSCRRG